MEKLFNHANIESVVMFAVTFTLALVYRAYLGDLIAQGGQLLYWQLGIHHIGSLIISAGVTFESLPLTF